MGENIKGPGLLYVNSKISQPDKLTEEQFLKWYGTDHIPEILATSGVESAFRFKAAEEKNEKPYLALYPMKDIAFTQTEEFKKIAVHSDLLPDTGPIYDLANFDTRYYGLIQVYARNGDPKPGQVKTLVTAGFEFENAHIEEDFDDWYRKEHLERVATVPGYIRSTRYKLLYHRNNNTSRLMKGLQPRSEDNANEDPPTNLAIHEFESPVQNLDVPALMGTADTEWSKAVMGRAIKTELPLFMFAESFGDKKFFDGVSV